ncbi:uncharacterized protein BKA78DRAFT_310675 [Phyllosticta capitalensis]|uniref:uncharacterized protein n=1 Tax=Phyllosticta capitalensis TaxID=121624 RepID=UPI00312E67AC
MATRCRNRVGLAVTPFDSPSAAASELDCHAVRWGWYGLLRAIAWGTFVGIRGL